MKKSRISVFIIFCLGIILLACNAAPKVKISNGLYSYLNGNCHEEDKKNRVVYYFDGDCSFCIGRVIELDERFRNSKDTMSINIALTRNPAYLKFQLKERNISPCVIISTNATEYDTLIRKEFELNKIYLIDKDQEISQFNGY